MSLLENDGGPCLLQLGLRLRCAAVLCDHAVVGNDSVRRLVDARTESDQGVFRSETRHNFLGRFAIFGTLSRSAAADRMKNKMVRCRS